MQGQAPASDADLGRQREVVEAFLAAAREGHFAALLAVLDADVVLRVDRALLRDRGRSAVRAPSPERALAFSRVARFSRPALVNGAAGLLTAPGGEPLAVMGFTIRHGRIVEMDILTDPERLARLELVSSMTEQPANPRWADAPCASVLSVSQAARPAILGQ